MNPSKYGLNGKVALITGAGGLLGPLHAQALLECGASIILTDVNEMKLISVKNSLLNQNPEYKIYTSVMNVTLENEIKIVSDFYKKIGLNIDILINNAAIDPKFDGSKDDVELSRLENFSLENWNKQIAVGLTGAFLCSKEFGSLMAANGSGGVIVNIASDLSVISPDQRLYKVDDISHDMQPVKPVSYSVVKSGLVGLTKYLATYWPDKKVRCNALSPGGIFTNHDSVFVERLLALIPLGRMANADDYVGAIQFLCSDASSYMNGHNLVIDGGRTIW